MKLDFLKIFNHNFSKYFIYKRVSLIHCLYIGLLAKVKQKSGTKFWDTFLSLNNTLSVDKVSISGFFICQGIYTISYFEISV